VSNSRKTAAILLLAALILPFLSVATLLAAGWSKLGIYNAVIPHDRGTECAARDVAYGAHARQKLDVYRPDDGSSGNPVLMFIYGGSWDDGDKKSYSFVGRAFAAAGYVTVIADYRLVPQVRYPDFVKDGAKALAWVKTHIENFGGSPDRIFLLGHSAGAYNAMMLALDPHFLRAEGLSSNVVKAVAGLSGPYDFLPLDVKSTKAAFAGAADLKATQPVNHVTQRTPPVFLATGDKDDLVRPKNTRALTARLKAAGRPHQTRIYKDIGHAGILLAISRPLRGKAPVIEDVTAFFQNQ